MPSINVSIIIPALNEERRLLSTLRWYTDAFGQRYGENFELIVVANGCTDDTARIAINASQAHSQIRVINIVEKVGKGGAVLEGFRRAAGERVLFADADASTAPVSLLELVEALDRSDIVIGSRRLPHSTITIERSYSRRFLSRAFMVTVHGLFNLPYRDTQCGAKAFTRHAARVLAPEISETGWAFDVDLLLSARRLRLSVQEHPVVWADSSGSRMRFWSTLAPVCSSLWRLSWKSAVDRRSLQANAILEKRES